MLAKSPQVPRSAEIPVSEFEILREKFEQRCPQWPFEPAAQGLLEFFELVRCQDEPIALLRKDVDELWHLFIIFTPQYRSFCDRYFGFFVDHQPHTSSTPVPGAALTGFFKAYRACHGREPAGYWLTDLDEGTVGQLRRGQIPQGFAYEWSGWTGRPKI